MSAKRSPRTRTPGRSSTGTRARSTASRPAGGRRWWPLTRTRVEVLEAGGRRAATTGLRRAAEAGSIDPLFGPRLALAGRVVTMDANDTVLADGVVYVNLGEIVGVRDRLAPRPAGFEETPIVETGGTLFPGLIELHNHLCYDALPAWAPIPALFEHTGQWKRHPDYGRLISGPMTVVGRTPSLVPSLVRYVEVKCLLAGVTSSQGIRLASNGGVSTYYRGLVRNVEQTGDPALPDALARIVDVAAKDAGEFLASLEAALGVPRCQILHLAEGVTRPGDKTPSARRHFLALEVAPGEWAINQALAGIHSSALLPEDLRILAGLKGSIVWSPLSNLLLYGATTDIATARGLGVRLGLGSDWSPTGSKNLLGELKVAWLYSQHFLEGLLTARDLVAMATRTAAEILRWDNVLGSLEAGKRADILVIDEPAGDPHEALIRATELSVKLVMINGIARYGTPAMMQKTAPEEPTLETFRLNGKARALYLYQATTHPAVAPISLAAARETLSDALLRIQDFARDLERASATAESAAAADREGVVWSLALDELRPTGLEMRPRLPYAGQTDFTGPSLAETWAETLAVMETAGPLEPIALDPLTVVEDTDYLDQIAAQPNVPREIRDGLRELY